MTEHAPETPETPDVTWFLANADHTLLSPAATAAELAEFLDSARDLGVKRVCISPSQLPLTPETRADLQIVTVVGFPTGAHRPAVKAAEAAQAVADGADEIDMVVNRGLVSAGDWAGVEEDIRAVRAACAGRVLKVILESATLTEDEIVRCCRAAEAAGADFVKTSTGFDAAGGASAEAVRIMADAVGERLGVKASGGIRTAEAVRELVAAGATRFGVSATAAIVADWDRAPAVGEADAPADRETHVPTDQTPAAQAAQNQAY
ncbi:deoxyribose-phosphate aldolase [Leucobacter luti]|uniref:deoxyribose-phosphate aldolase n=1 Tax=Leucobacter luti TaxID=340320 RepID=UPI003CFD77EF